MSDYIHVQWTWTMSICQNNLTLGTSVTGLKELTCLS